MNGTLEPIIDPEEFKSSSNFDEIYEKNNLFGIMKKKDLYLTRYKRQRKVIFQGKLYNC